jgi:hypothetical protein
VELYHHFPNTSSWCGAQLNKKAQGQLYLYFTVECNMLLGMNFQNQLAFIYKEVSVIAGQLKYLF